MRSFLINSALALATIAVLGFGPMLAPTATAAGCTNTNYPQAYLQVYGKDASGGLPYTIYKWDADNYSVPGSLALYNSQGQIKNISSAGYIQGVWPKGAGYGHVDMTDVNSCGQFVRWVRSGIVLFN